MAIYGNAAADYIIRSASLPSSTTFSASFWFAIAVDRNASGVIFAMGDGVSNAIYARLHTTGTQLEILTSSDAEVRGTDLTVGTWYHIGLVRNNSDNTFKLYLNGNLDITLSTSLSFTPTTMIMLSDTASYVNAAVDCIKLWDASLTQDEIRQEMNKMLPVRTANLHLWSPTHPGTTERGLDYSGNGRDWTQNGTLTDLTHAPISWGAQAITPFYPSAAGDIVVALDAATLVSSGQVLTAVPGAVSTSLVVAALTASGQVSTVVPGAVSSILDAAALAAQGQPISILPGAVSSSLDAAVLSASGQVVTVSLVTPVVVNLLAANLSAQGQASSIVPGAISQILTAAALSAVGQTAPVVPGAISTTLAAAILAANGQTVTVSIVSGVLVNLQAASLSSQGQVITPIGGPVTSSLDAAALSASGQTLSMIPGGVNLALDSATLVTSGQVINVQAGAVSILLAAASLVATGQVITAGVPPDLLVNLSVAMLFAQGQAIHAQGGTIILPGGSGGPFTRPDYPVPYDMRLVIEAQNIIDEEEIVFLV